MSTYLRSKNAFLLPGIAAIIGTLLTIGCLPDGDPVRKVLLCVSNLLPLWIVLECLSAGSFFTILNFCSLIQYIESFGGIISIHYLREAAANEAVTTDSVYRASDVYFAGYLFFLAGYAAVFRFVTRKRTMQPREYVGAPDFLLLSPTAWRVLFLLIVATLGMACVKFWFRIEAAGGLWAYLATMYTYRIGAFSEDSEANALGGLATLIGGLTTPLLGIGLLSHWSHHSDRAQGRILCVLICATIVMAALSGFRGTFVFTMVAFVAMYNSVRPFNSSMLLFGSLVLAVCLVLYNHVHYLMYTLTADWDSRSFADTLCVFAGPHRHLSTLSVVLDQARHGDVLKGEGLLESVLFFIPRFLWRGKIDLYGTAAVQDWAQMPTHYQAAVTAVGELIAHLGYWGLPLMVLHGGVQGLFECMRFGKPYLVAGLYCIVLPRTLSHSGMGISALSITCFSLLFFLSMCKLVEGVNGREPYRKCL